MPRRRLSAQATLAQTYFLMRTAEIQQALLERTAQGYQRSLDLAQVRYEGGVAARTDVLLAKTQLTSAQAQAIESADAARAARARDRRAARHAAVVVRRSRAAASSRPSPVVPQMLPATLLERRPDIAAAQRRVAAAYWQIGVADAAFFPSLTLSASATYRNSVLGNLFSAPNLFWSLGPSLALAILDGGQRQLASSQARAGADQATATYRQSVLTALQDVEDNLVLADQLQQQAQLQAEALEAAQRNLEITLEQYRAGTVELHQRRGRAGAGAQQRKQPARLAEPPAGGGEPVAEEHRRPLGERAGIGIRARRMRPALLRDDPGGLDHLAGFADFLVHEFPEFGGRHRHRVGAERREPLLHVGRRQRAQHVPIDLLDEIGGRAGRREHADPEVVVEAGKARFGDRRHVRQHARSLGGAHAQRGELAFAHLRQRRRNRREEVRDPARHRVGQRLGRALVGNVDARRCRRRA